MGIVRTWSDAEGWGILDSPETPGGCWAHYSAVVMDGYHRLTASQAVSFEFEPGPQDGYDFRATLIRPEGVVASKPSEVPGTDESGADYGSELILHWRDGTITRRQG